MSGSQETFLREAREAVERANQQVNQRQRGALKLPYVIRTFTDNIVIGMPVQPADLLLGIEEITSLVVGYQAAMVAHGFLVRGGIASGQHFMDAAFVFGDALIEAAKLDTPGGPPLVGYSPEVSAYIKENGIFASMRSSPWRPRQPIVEDSSGMLFVNYLSLAFDWIEDGGVYEEILDGHSKALRSGWKENVNSPEVASKYRWAIDYHNRCLKNLVQYYHDWHEDEGLGMSGETPAGLSRGLNAAYALVDL